MLNYKQIWHEIKSIHSWINSTLHSLDWFSIDAQLVESAFQKILISIRLVENHRDRKKGFRTHVLHFCFFLSQLIYIKKMFVFIWVKDSKVLFLNNRYGLFAPYFCIFYIHACIFINFSQKFQTLGILGFLMFEFVLISFD